MKTMFVMMFVALFALVSSPAEATDRHVGIGQAYATIQGAVNAANSGDFIVVHTGTYAERIVVDNPNITELFIKAYGTDVVTIDTPSNYATSFIVQDASLYLKNLTVLAPYKTSPPQKGIILNSSTGNTDYNVVMCNADLVGDSITSSVGVVCGEANGDEHFVFRDTATSITNFGTPIGGACTANPSNIILIIDDAGTITIIVRNTDGTWTCGAW